MRDGRGGQRGGIEWGGVMVADGWEEETGKREGGIGSGEVGDGGG